MWQAWHIAALGRSGKMPDLDRLLDRGGEPAQTPAQMEAALRAWSGRINDRMKKAG